MYDSTESGEGEPELSVFLVSSVQGRPGAGLVVAVSLVTAPGSGKPQ